MLLPLGYYLVKKYKEKPPAASPVAEDLLDIVERVSNFAADIVAILMKTLFSCMLCNCGRPSQL